MSLSYEKVRQLLDYDPHTGEFYWVKTKGRARAGERAGATDAYGYRVIRVDGVLYKAHRLAWLWVYGCWPDGMLDHIDRDKGNNSIENLREATQSENMHNANRRSLSGVPGVRWRAERNRWVAQIRVGYRNYVLGSFATKDEAIAARRTAEATMISSIQSGSKTR